MAFRFVNVIPTSTGSVEGSNGVRLEESDHDASPSGESSRKKRKTFRACDSCRRKKIKCSGFNPGAKCENCTSQTLDCTFAGPDGVRRRRQPTGDSEESTRRMQQLENIIKKATGHPTLTPEFLNMLEADPELLTRPTDLSKSDIYLKLGTRFARNFPREPSLQYAADNGHDSEDEMHERFHGMVLSTDETETFKFPVRRENEDIPYLGKNAVLGLLYRSFVARGPKATVHTIRPSLWERPAWQTTWDDRNDPVTYEFPPSDLMPDLVDLYFKNVNIYVPLLHRPTFERSLEEGLALADKSFAGTVMLVCASGARFSKDPRVLLDTDEQKEASAGWKWFIQVLEGAEVLPVLRNVTLHELQKFTLLGLYIRGTLMGTAAWNIFGGALRLAYTIGVHRKTKIFDTRTKQEQELWKRAFWCLVWLDRFTSAGMGRNCAIHDEEIDIDYPTVCDDEYWYPEKDEDVFVQPENKPSTMKFFILALELSQITTFCMRTLYSLNKTQSVLTSETREWKEHLVVELDSALNRWIDSIPSYLRWDPLREDMVFFNQSVMIYCSYYHLSILAHRPFITKRSPADTRAMASVAVCTNAARVISHIVDCYLKRQPEASGVLSTCAMQIFCAALVLLLNVWTSKQSGLFLNFKNEMEDIHKCMEALRHIEARWAFSGCNLDILKTLSQAGDLPSPETPPRFKRGRDEGEEEDSSTPASSSFTPAESVPADFSLPVGHGLSDIEQMRAFNMSRRPGWEHSEAMCPDDLLSSAQSAIPGVGAVPPGGTWADFETMRDMPMQTPQNAAPFDLWPLGMEAVEWESFINDLQGNPTELGSRWPY
ncbi:hypothetical protein CYLTODRAFT_375321 [Cylindrobasidium torrendii FP15055 ss-10]|uniref:Zn(2)-C6 fungal-type domain-containing protein n=1 Tax=Cylindrobasidium torrendii FP15055 ss-10 TaxID=1314674 RepID=A0A0D7BBI0_9AGAR|nr:hypothetical protein CYLTODRAFT_375321 [Cylindrobasidium torrendii FP15055 ss-10]